MDRKYDPLVWLGSKIFKRAGAWPPPTRRRTAAHITRGPAVPDRSLRRRWAVEPGGDLR